MKGVIVFLLTVSLCGCAADPKHHDVIATAKIMRPYDAAWADVVGTLARWNMQIKTVAKDSGVIAAERTDFDNADADCGRYGWFVPDSHSFTLNVFMRRVDAQTIEMTVNAAFNERRTLDLIPIDVPCTSRGNLESLLLDAARPH